MVDNPYEGTPFREEISSIALNAAWKGIEDEVRQQYVSKLLSELACEFTTSYVLAPVSIIEIGNSKESGKPFVAFRTPDSTVKKIQVDAILARPGRPWMVYLERQIGVKKTAYYGICVLDVNLAISIEFHET